jgi:capsular polysaccharide biosynthesis protein
LSKHYNHTKQNDRFHVLDPANLPNEPSFPKLPLFAGGGFGGGLLLSLGLSLLLEMHDTSMRSEHDVEVVLHLPVLAMIPVIAANSGKVRPQTSLSVTYKAKEHAKV